MPQPQVTQRIRIPLRALIAASRYNSGIYAVPAATLVYGRLSASVLIDDQCIRRANLRPMDRAAVHRCALVCRRTAYKPRLEAIGR
jgi:hypothetical protein